MTDPDTISLAAAAITDHNNHNWPAWQILADWLNSITVRAEHGELGVDHDYATAFARALFDGTND